MRKAFSQSAITAIQRALAKSKNLRLSGCIRSVLEQLECRTLLSTVTADGWTTYSGISPNVANAPHAVMEVLAPVPVIGIGVDVRAVKSVLGAGTPITANYQWNFGDAGSERNTLVGFNAGHIYNTPGSYTIKLTVTNEQGQSSVATSTVTISGDNRRQIFVDAVSGNDGNDGSSPSKAVQSAKRADSLLRDNTEVLFQRGQTFPINSTFLSPYVNVLVGSYGSSSLPAPVMMASRTVNVMFATQPVSKGITWENLTMDTIGAAANPGDLNGLPVGFTPRGEAISVVGCTFQHVNYAVNSETIVTGLNIFDNTSPNTNGLRAYFLWAAGDDTVVLGNFVSNSLKEHVLRTSGADRILIADNNFRNMDGKGVVEIHVGTYAWVQGNKVNDGDIRVGPLGLWGESASAVTQYAVIQGNTVNDSVISVDPGSHDISIRNNIINRNVSQMINIVGQSSQEPRGTSDIQILNNTGISTGTRGNFLELQHPASGIILKNNLLVEPKYDTGSFNAAPIYVLTPNLSSFIAISGNVWQQPVIIDKWANGGINFVGTENKPTNYLNAGQWNALPQVGQDFFSDTPLTSALAPSTGTIAAGAASRVAGVFTDFYGSSRPASGSWSAGAVQVGGFVGVPSVPPPPVPQTPPPPPPPPPPPTGGGSSAGNLTSADIGNVGKAGSTSLSGSTYSVSGAGSDIFANSDGLHYSYQTLNGDGQIIARVASLSAANPWAKAGVMIRNDNSAGGKHVSMLISPNGQAEFERRWATGGITGTTDIAATAPTWVKIVRQGNQFTSSISTDGTNWTIVGTTQVIMNVNVEIGLAVSSHVVGTLENATFDNVSIVN